MEQASIKIFPLRTEVRRRQDGRFGRKRDVITTDIPTQKPVPVLFSLDEAERASDEWNFNCGPSALCAVLGMTPSEIRPHMLDFESKGYTNPTLMFDVLKRLNVTHYQCYRSDNPIGLIPRVPLGLLRVQWGGPWTKPGVPMRVRYRQTHWAGMCGGWMFDVNAMCSGGWLSFAEWSSELIPWLIRECISKGDGKWWPTHVIAVAGKSVPIALPRSDAKRVSSPKSSSPAASQASNQTE